VRNHPCSDGNKRVALLAALTFLAINGPGIEATDDDVLATTVALAAGHIGELEFAAWLRARVVSIQSTPIFG
jgi:death-on-curing protein